MSIPPIIVLGMHRSGTSLLASMLQAAGLKLGDELVSADAFNPYGYYENRSFVAFQRSLLRTIIPTSTSSLPDWGWSEQGARYIDEWLKSSKRQRAEEVAVNLLKRYGSTDKWGWKDPRTSLLLPLWEALEPNAWVIGIYRYPWEILNALQRLKPPSFPPIFWNHPDWAIKIWTEYNECILARQIRRPEKTILINSGALIENPRSLVDVLSRRLGWQISDESIKSILTLPKPGLHRGYSNSDEITSLYRLSHKDSSLLLDRLQERADVSSEVSVISTRLLTCKDKPYLDQSMPPQLAIIITSCDNSDHLIECIASVERETEAANIKEYCELIVVDNGSIKREDIDILNRLASAGYRIILRAERDLASARNYGASLTHAEVIIHLDADSILYSPYLELGLERMRVNTDIAIIYADRISIGPMVQTVQPGKNAQDHLEKINLIHLTALIRRSWWNLSGGFKSNPERPMEWSLWNSIKSQGGRFSYIPCIAFGYRSKVTQ